jgi:RNA polymerase sigma-70 factor (ECF subfamily)
VTSIGLHLDNGRGLSDLQADFRHDDGALLRGLQAGDNSAYEELVHRFQQPVYNLVSRLMADPDDAGDVVQEVFLKVFRSIGNFRGQSSLKTWIYRIAVNEGYNHRRWFSRHRKQEVGLDAEVEGTRTYQDVLPDPTRSPFDATSDHETHQLIERGLATLNPNFRAAVVLRDIEDLSYEDAGEFGDGEVQDSAGARSPAGSPGCSHGRADGARRRAAWLVAAGGGVTLWTV